MEQNELGHSRWPPPRRRWWSGTGHRAGPGHGPGPETGCLAGSAALSRCSPPWCPGLNNSTHTHAHTQFGNKESGSVRRRSFSTYTCKAKHLVRERDQVRAFIVFTWPPWQLGGTGGRSVEGMARLCWNMTDTDALQT